jgi:3-dehydroquinate synthase
MKRCFTLAGKSSDVRVLSKEESLEALLSETFPDSGGASLWIADSNSARYLPKHVHSLVIPPGEAEKGIKTVLAIVDAALSLGAGRDARFFALGGGVVCDMAAFAASVYMRGVDVVLVPTTLLSMVDASIGGKSGVDHGGYKNIIGSFYPASHIVIDPCMLETLPERELKSGMAEIIKHAMLSGRDAMEELKQLLPSALKRDVASLRQLIERSLEVKGSIIEKDPLEKGIRAHLNLGHTFGHALESALSFTGCTHGEAVAWGILRALKAGELLGITESSYRAEVEKIVTDTGYPVIYKASPERIVHAIGSDKKKKRGEVHFVLQKRRGETLLSPLPEEIILESVKSGCTQ